MLKETERKRLAETIGVDPGHFAPNFDIPLFDPWKSADHDLLVLQFMKDKTTPEIWSAYKDCLYHETKGHGTHNVWEYKKGKFANAMIMWLDSRATGGST